MASTRTRSSNTYLLNKGITMVENLIAMIVADPQNANPQNRIGREFNKNSFVVTSVVFNTDNAATAGNTHVTLQGVIAGALKNNITFTYDRVDLSPRGVFSGDVLEIGAVADPIVMNLASTEISQADEGKKNNLMKAALKAMNMVVQSESDIGFTFVNLENTTNDAVKKLTMRVHENNLAYYIDKTPSNDIPTIVNNLVVYVKGNR